VRTETGKFKSRLPGVRCKVKSDEFVKGVSEEKGKDAEEMSNPKTGGTKRSDQEWWLAVQHLPNYTPHNCDSCRWGLKKSNREFSRSKKGASTPGRWGSKKGGIRYQKNASEPEKWAGRGIKSQ